MIRYTAEGTAAGGQTWKAEGTVEGDFPDCFMDAMKDSFKQLTQGKAVFGKPGVGCRGPYQIHHWQFVKVSPGGIAAADTMADRLASAECIIRQISRDTYGEDLSPKEFADRAGYDS